jgi:uncharacterized DUF497 family protein
LDEIPDGYEWDASKARTNLAKHAVSFAEAVTVFDDRYELTTLRTAYVRDEDRFLTVGRAATGRFLAVAYAYREDRIRVISARPATQRERKRYDQDERRPIGFP